ncbi:MAG: phenylacetate-CoA oxygenase subunit PaaC [Sphingobacteriales bacterium]|nr:phenylacetate-CoA oxygenase subunit PaaC [Sphingobacteriales bacterium]
MSALIDYTLHLADNSLILGQRNGEWCGHGPILEQDIAITNISLDLIGQARSLYQYAAVLINDSELSVSSKASSPLERRFGGEVSEDSLAYLRTEREFKNCLLVEQSNGDWAQTILRQFLFSSYQYYLYQYLQTNTDTTIAAIAEKSLKEVSYHLRWSSEWVIRLGDGTGESHGRMLKAIDELWRYTGEFFIPADYEKELKIDGASLKYEWSKKIKTVFDEATLTVPPDIFMQEGGKQGRHTEQLGYILTELQYMQRAYPGCEW